jgi:hypothetical protein
MAFRQRNGREFDGRPVWDLKRGEAQSFKGRWDKILDLLAE